MMSAVLSNPNHPEYGVATIPFPIPHDQYTYCIQTQIISASSPCSAVCGSRDWSAAARLKRSPRV